MTMMRRRTRIRPTEPVSAQYQPILFPGMDELFRLLGARSLSDRLVLKGINRDYFLQIMDERMRRHSPCHFFYASRHGLLEITRPHLLRDLAQQRLYDAIESQCKLLRNVFLWLRGDGTAYASEVAGETDSRREAACCGGPLDGTFWPSLVIESNAHAGYAERVRSGVPWWFYASKGQVQIVLVVYAEPWMRTMRIEQYTMPMSRTGPGGPTFPRLRQAINICPEEGRGPGYSADGDLILPKVLLFRDLVYEDGRPTPVNVVVSAQELAALAKDCFQDFQDEVRRPGY